MSLLVFFVLQIQNLDFFTWCKCNFGCHATRYINIFHCSYKKRKKVEKKFLGETEAIFCKVFVTQEC